MRSPMSSNLVCLIEQAIDDCYSNGEGRVNDVPFTFKIP